VRSLDEALAQLRATSKRRRFSNHEIDIWATTAWRGNWWRCASNARRGKPPAQQGRLLIRGLTVVIAGAPNAGNRPYSPNWPARGCDP